MIKVANLTKFSYQSDHHSLPRNIKKLLKESKTRKSKSFGLIPNSSEARTQEPVPPSLANCEGRLGRRISRSAAVCFVVTNFFNRVFSIYFSFSFSELWCWMDSLNVSTDANSASSIFFSFFCALCIELVTEKSASALVLLFWEFEKEKGKKGAILL